MTPYAQEETSQTAEQLQFYHGAPYGQLPPTAAGHVLHYPPTGAHYDPRQRM